MNYLRYNTELPEILNQFFENDLEKWSKKNYSRTHTTLPAVNIIENKEAYEVQMAAPGFKKGDFNIELDNDLLTISSEKEVDNEIKEDEVFTRKEFSYQSFTRSFRLPELIENEKIKAAYKDGILKIVIPKKDESKPKPARKISVK
jgi:HSP20 family protein